MPKESTDIARLEEAWLSIARSQPGMFSNELAITVLWADGREDQYFVPIEEVRDDKVRIQFEKRDDNGGYWAHLPTSERLPAIPVQKSELSFA